MLECIGARCGHVRDDRIVRLPHVDIVPAMPHELFLAQVAWYLATNFPVIWPPEAICFPFPLIAAIQVVSFVCAIAWLWGLIPAATSQRKRRTCAMERSVTAACADHQLCVIARKVRVANLDGVITSPVSLCTPQLVPGFIRHVTIRPTAWKPKRLRSLAPAIGSHRSADIDCCSVVFHPFGEHREPAAIVEADFRRVAIFGSFGVANEIAFSFTEPQPIRPPAI